MYIVLIMDTNWITEFEAEDKLYADFYKEDLNTVNLIFLYVSNNNELTNITKDTYILNNNVITKNELIFIIRKNSIKNTIRYRLLSMLQYNFVAEPEEITKNDNFLLKTSYLNPLSSITDIYWKQSISFMHDLNTLYIVYYDNPKVPTHNTTKKIYLTKKSTKHNRKTRRRHKLPLDIK